MKITVQVDGLKDAQDVLSGFSDRRMRAAQATGLTRTAVEVRDAIKAELPRVFDRPTPYTMNSLFVRPATADRLVAETYFKDETTQQGIPATKYLLPNVVGGGRALKRFEVALKMTGRLPAGWQVVPGAGAKLDVFGNMSRGQIIQILSQLRITLTAGHDRNLPFDARKQIRAQRKAGGRFFVIPPGKKGAAPGIYQREFTGRNITPVVIFVRATSYRARFDFHGIARRVAEDRLRPNIERAIVESAVRLGARGE